MKVDKHFIKMEQTALCARGSVCTHGALKRKLVKPGSIELRFRIDRTGSRSSGAMKLIDDGDAQFEVKGPAGGVEVVQSLTRIDYLRGEFVIVLDGGTFTGGHITASYIFDESERNHDYSLGDREAG